MLQCVVRACMGTRLHVAVRGACMHAWAPAYMLQCVVHACMGTRLQAHLCMAPAVLAWMSQAMLLTGPSMPEPLVPYNAAPEALHRPCYDYLR